MTGIQLGPRREARRAARGAFVRPRRVGAVAIDLVLVAVLLALIPQTLELSEEARRFPIWTIAVLLALLALDLAVELLPPARRALRFLESDFIATTSDKLAVDEVLREQDEQQAEQAQESRLRGGNTATALAWLVGLGVAMYYVGYVIVTPVFLAAFFLWARVPLKVAVGVTVVMSLFNYFVFYDYLALR